MLSKPDSLLAQESSYYCGSCTVDEVDFPGSPTACYIYGNEGINQNIGSGSGSVSYTATEFPSMSTVTGQNFYVQGTLVINSNIKFILCHFRMAEGSAIITDNAHNFKDQGSIYYACEKMWKGITISTEGKLENTYISDAEYGVLVNTTLDVKSIGTTYDRCYVGIKNEIGIATMNLLQFNNNTFSCTSPLNAPYSGQTTIPGNITRAGMEINNCATTIGNSNSINYFDNLIWGIKTFNADLVINKCRFTDMEMVTGLPAMSGVGIHAGFSSNIIVNGYNETFTDNERMGIYSFASSIDVTDCNFTGQQQYGIFSDGNNSYQTVVITNNDFYLNTLNTIDGIFIVRPNAPLQTSSAVFVDDNLFDVTKLINAAVRVQVLYKALDFCDIFTNRVQFTGDGDGNGILIRGAGDAGFRVSENIIDYDATTTPAGFNGIYFHQLGVEGLHEISGNRITGEPSKGVANGIEIDVTQGVELCGNLTNKTEKGIQFRGDCDPIFLSSNEMKNNDDGLYIRDQSVPSSFGRIGDQLHTLNEWPSTAYGNYAATNIAFSPSLSEFQVEDMISPTWPPSIYSPNGTWFFDVDGTPNICESEMEMLSLPGLSEVESALIEGQVIGFEDTELSRWELNNVLFQKLSNYTELIEGNSTAAAYYADMEASDIGQLQYVEDMVTDAFHSDHYQDALTLTSQIQEALASLIAWENELPVPADDDWDYEIDPAYLEFRTGVLAEITAWRLELNAISEGMTEARSSGIDNIENYLGGIEAGSELAQATKDLFTIRLQLYRQLPLSPEQKGRLDEIAGSSVEQYGHIVNLAQAMLPICEQLLFQSFRADRNTAKAERLQVAALTIFPNPASDEVRIHFAKTGKLSLLNSSGQMIQTANIDIPGYSLSLNVSNLPSGMYYVHQLCTDGSTASAKLVITSGN